MRNVGRTDAGSIGRERASKSARESFRSRGRAVLAAVVIVDDVVAEVNVGCCPGPLMSLRLARWSVSGPLAS